MAQVARELKRIGLELLPRSARMRLLERHPTLRKAAPHDLVLRFDRYLGEFTVNIDTRYKVERIMWSGMYEPDLVLLLGRWLQPDWVCFDIGANVGATTLAMAQCMHGGSGAIHSFEPAPETFRRLEANLDLNPEARRLVRSVNVGVGREPGVLQWSEEAGNEGNGGLLAPTGIAVPVTTLDVYAAENDLARLDFIKIDVESMEYEVLVGATETLRRFQPRLYFETMGRSRGLREADIFRRIEDLLRGLGYDLFRLDRSKNLVPTRASEFADYTIAEPKRT